MIQFNQNYCTINISRSRRASTKLVSAATKSAILQTTPEFHKSFSSTIEKVSKIEKKSVPDSKSIPQKKNIGRTPVSEGRKKVNDDNKKINNSFKSSHDGERTESPLSKKRQSSQEKGAKKKKKTDESENDDTITRRSKRETTRISTLATLNSSNASDIDSQSVASSTDTTAKQQSPKKKEVIVPQTSRSKRKTTELSTLATQNASYVSDIDSQSVASSTDTPAKKQIPKKKELILPQSSRSKRKTTELSSLASFNAQSQDLERISSEPKDSTLKVNIKSTVDKLKNRIKTTEPKLDVKNAPSPRKEIGGTRRSARSTTAISTLASANAANQAPFVVAESSEEEEEGEESDTVSNESEHQYEAVQKKNRGRPKATSISLSPNNPFALVSKEYKEQQKMAAKLKRKRKSSLSPDPEDRPRLLTEEENNRLFDSLFDANSASDSERTPVRRPVASKKPDHKRSTVTNDKPLSSQRQSKKLKRDSEPVSTKEEVKEEAHLVPNAKPAEEKVSSSSLKWIKSTPVTTQQSSRVIAPWRQMFDASKLAKNSNQNNDIYDFGGSSEDSNSNKKINCDNNKIVKDPIRSESTSPERKMFMVAKHGAYSGQLAGLKKKLEQNNSKSTENNKRSPTRLLFGSSRVVEKSESPASSPTHAHHESPKHDSSQKVSSSSPSHKTGSPRIDPSQRIGMPKILPSNRLGARLGGAIKGATSQNQSHQLSLTSLSSDYNIVAAVDKYHNNSNAIGQSCNENILAN